MPIFVISDMHIRVSDRGSAARRRGARGRPGRRWGATRATRAASATRPCTRRRSLRFISLNNAVRERVRSASDESDPPLSTAARAARSWFMHVRGRRAAWFNINFSFASSLCCPMLTSLQNRPVQIAEEGPCIGKLHKGMGAHAFLCAGGHLRNTCTRSRVYAQQHPRRNRSLPRLVSPTCHLRRLSS